MKFLLKPSLEHMALVKIGISLWNQNDVRTLISKLHFFDLYSSEKWKTIEEIVTKKVTHLSLPQLLKERVLGVIKPIGLELVDWRMYILKKCDDFHLNENLLVDLCWTPQGTIDGKRTAELLVKDERLDISTRYELACVYYLEEDIHKLWNSVPEDPKEYNWHFSETLNFWSDIIKRGETGHICYKFEFLSSVRRGYKFAAKYFFQKLTPREREESLEELPEHYFNDVEFPAVLCILLPEMEEEEQKKVFKNFPVDVLWYFLRWPLQSFFLGVANCMWDCLSKDSYEDILVCIAAKVTDGYQDYDYRKLFREFWQKSPNALRDSVIAEIGDGLFVKDLCCVKDKEIIRLLLKDATLVQKEKLIYSDEITNILIDSIYDDEWDNVEFFIQECLSSTNERLKFKEEFEKKEEFEIWTCIREWSATEKQKWNQLFHFSDNFVCKYSKRSLEGGENSSSKRFQSLQ